MRRDEIRLAPPPNNDRPADAMHCGRLCDGSGIGHCPRGPRRGGLCGADKDPCIPELTHRGFRRRVLVAGTLVGLVALAAWSFLSSRTFYKPGPLSRSHALILASHSANDHCAACHPAASASWTSWFASAAGVHQGVSQTDRCVDCHHVQMAHDVARSPHNLGTARLQQIREAWNERDSGTGISLVGQVSTNLSRDVSIECATCHREHGGVDANLSLMSNAQCQSCHSRSFESFASGHPDWKAWPHTGAKIISFDHATHQHLHFPKSKPIDRAAGQSSAQVQEGQEIVSPSDLVRATVTSNVTSNVMGRQFDCRACHPSNPLDESSVHTISTARRRNTGEPLRTLSYEAACADCHDAALRERSTQRLDLFALPSLGREPATQAGVWPNPLIGFFDGEVGPLATWLLRSDQAVAVALTQLPGDASITSINPSRADQIQAAVKVSVAIRDTIDKLATQGSAAVVTHGNERSADAMRQVLRNVPPQMVWDARLLWFTAPPSSIAQQPPLDRKAARLSLFDLRRSDRVVKPAVARTSANDDLLSDDLLEGDLLGDALLGSDSQSTDPLAVDPLNADPLAADPLAVGPSSQGVIDPGQATPLERGRFDPVHMLPDGGWYRDDLRMAISYRSSGHADPVLRAAVELAASLQPDDPVRIGLLKSGATASCVECHWGALDPDGPLWKMPLLPRNPSALTKFSHKPHFNLPQLSDCTHCHKTNQTAVAVVSMISLPPAEVAEHQARHGFQSLGKSACIACHRQSAAGDGCTQCHHYHSRQ